MALNSPELPNRDHISSMLPPFQQDGFVIVPAILNNGQIETLKMTLTPLWQETAGAGVRGLAQKFATIRQLAQSSSVRALVEPILGPHARLVRSLFFNKSPDSNWQVPWHQDLSIAVRARIDTAGFGGWSEKEGIPHVQPPVPLLEKMLTVRLHLDDADHENGALWVAPGSHRCGRLTMAETAAAVERHGQHLCAARAGDALLMRPLLLHASRKAESDAPRRVIHLEFAGCELPAPLAWHEG